MPPLTENVREKSEYVPYLLGLVHPSWEQFARFAPCCVQKQCARRGEKNGGGIFATAFFLLTRTQTPFFMILFEHPSTLQR